MSNETQWIKIEIEQGHVYFNGTFLPKPDHMTFSQWFELWDNFFGEDDYNELLDQIVYLESELKQAKKRIEELENDQ